MKFSLGDKMYRRLLTTDHTDGDICTMAVICEQFLLSLPPPHSSALIECNLRSLLIQNNAAL
jgi:hypothetical protein